MNIKIYKKIFLIGFVIFAGFGFAHQAFATASVYYSVGQNTTDHKTCIASDCVANPLTVTISGGVATFSTAQTATNMGVGDKVTYNTNVVAYISGKTSTSVWTLVTVKGATPADVSSPVAVNSIAHTFIHLADAVNASTGAGNVAYLGTANLVTGDYILNIPCYYDTGADTTAVSASSWTTGANNYIHIYTPSSTVSEVNQSQRAGGKWNTGKYRLEVANSVPLLDYANYSTIDGLQIYKTSSNTSNAPALGLYPTGAGVINVSNSIIRTEPDNTSTYTQPVILINDVSLTANIWNSVLYGSGTYAGSDNSGIHILNSTAVNIYSTTVQGGYKGIYREVGTVICKNCYAKSLGIGGAYNGTITKTTSASADATGSAGLQNIAYSTANFANVTAGSENLHLLSGSALINAGTDSSGDSAPLNFTNDIDGETRTSTWDIGADEFVPYTIGGSISSLSGTVVLQNNLGDNLSRSANGSFTFATSLSTGSSYSVTVSSQPTGQTCTVTNGSGTVTSANITNVSVSCVNNADTTNPTPGSSGTITTASVTDQSLTLNWTKGTDDTSAQGALQYIVYKSSSNNIDTVTNIETNGTALNSYTTDIATLPVTGLSPSTTYYFNVIVKDEAGNKAAYTMKSQATIADGVAPTMDTFTIPSTATSLTVSISSFTAHDDIAVAGYLATTTSTAPASNDSTWLGSAPTTYTFSSAGAKTLYGWVKDAAGNVSTSLSGSVTITLPGPQDIYVAQTSAGSANGTSCANTYAVTFFNTSGNWANPKQTGKIGPGDTVHLCGTISTNLRFQNSGTAGSLITLLWETDAKVSLPMCNTEACVNVNGNSYVILDGGTNGIIENTANGSLLANHSSSYGVNAPTCTNCEVKNLTVQNIYVHTPTVNLVSVVGDGVTATGTCTGACGFVAGVTARIASNSVSGFNGDFTILTASGSTFTFTSATSGTGTGGVVGDITPDPTLVRGIYMSGSNWSVHNNVLHDISWAVFNAYGAGDTGGRIYNNEIYNIDHGIIVEGVGPNDVGPFYIYNNHLHDFQNWDSPVGHWHHDGIHAFTGNSGGFPNVTQLWIYNNLFDGDAGDNMTAHIFLEGNSGSPWTRSVADGGTGRAIVFNNVSIGTPGRVVNSYVQVGNSSGSEVYNNTMLCGSTNPQCFIANNALNYKFKNNFVSGSSNTLVNFAGTTSFADPGDLNNNVYANCSSSGHNCFVWHGTTWTDNFATFKAATGGDANSVATIGTSGGVNATGVVQTGSPAISAGANLTSLGYTTLNSDKAGVARPGGSTAWDIGAYNYSAPTTFTIGGTISGLSGTVVLQNNGGDNYSTSTNGSFVFATALNNSASYAVTVSTQPSGQTCTVGSGTGTVLSANVTTVTVSCTNNITNISSAGVTDFTAPATGGTPQVFETLTAGLTQYTVTGLTWSPTDNPYHAATAYTATVTLTSAATYKFPTGGIAVPTANGGGTVSAGTTSGGDISGNTLTFTVLFPSTAAKTTPTLSISNSPVTYNTSPQSATVSGSVAGVVSNILYSGSGTTPTNAGTYAITADFAPTDSANYNSLTGASAGNFVINTADQGALTAISTPSTVPYGTTATLSSSGGSGTGAVTFSVGASTGCNITGGTTLNVSNPAGTCTVTATKAADTNYNSATSAGLSVTLTKGTQATLTVIGLPASAVYQEAGISAGTSGGSGTGAVTFSAGVSTACSIDSSTGAVAITASSGSCLITATKATDTNYNSATSGSVSIAVGTAPQTITVSTPAPASATYNGTFPVAAMASSGLTVAITTTGGCSISTGTVTMTSGTTACTVHYNQTGDSNYSAATEVTSVTTAVLATQSTLTFTGETVTTPTTFSALSTTGGSGTGAVSYAVTTAGTAGCSIVGTTLSYTTTGTCGVTATKVADTNYNSVSSSEATFTVNAAPITTHTITTSAGANGSISPSGSVSVNNGSDQAFTFTPNSGYHIDTVTADSVAVSATSPYTFTNVTADHTISATFAADAVSSGGGGGGPVYPSIYSVTASSTTPTSATITWTTNYSAASEVDYGTTTAYGLVASSSLQTLLHSLIIGNLTPATTYQFMVKSSLNGSVASSANYSFTTLSSSGEVIPIPTTTSSPSLTALGLPLRLINQQGTYYLILNGQRHGITNPGMLYTYGFTFDMGQTATAEDLNLPEGSLLTPNNGSLVKSKEDQTVYFISNQQRYGFTSAKVFTSLGFKFSSVLVVTDPELQQLPKADNLDNGLAQHLPGLDINKDGTIYWIGGDNFLHGYPSLNVYNSWHIPNDFSRVVPANSADLSLPVGDIVAPRVIN